MRKLLQQDVILMMAKWAEAGQQPVDETLAPEAWRHQYQDKLETAIAVWLSKCLVMYQDPAHRPTAFIPIEYLIGTSKETTNYIESLAWITEELESVKDPRYGKHPRKAFQEYDFIVLGDCFRNAIAKSVELLAQWLGGDQHDREHCFNAIADALSLAQAVTPDRLTFELYSAWKTLRSGNAANVFEAFSKSHPWVMEHAFVLALYPACYIGAEKEVKYILDDIKKKIDKKGSKAPKQLKLDLYACIKMVSVETSKNPKSRPALHKAPKVCEFGSAICNLEMPNILGAVYTRNLDHDQHIA